jgi:hypothetical protein
MCGRAMIVSKKPQFCYFDRMDSIEQISADDSVKMGLFGGGAKQMLEDIKDMEGIKPFIPEFRSDVVFDPFTGQKNQDSLFKLLDMAGKKFGLHEYQRKVMEKVTEC